MTPIATAGTAAVLSSSRSSSNARAIAAGGTCATHRIAREDGVAHTATVMHDPHIRLATHNSPAPEPTSTAARGRPLIGGCCNTDTHAPASGSVDRVNTNRLPLLPRPSRTLLDKYGVSSITDDFGPSWTAKHHPVPPPPLVLPPPTVTIGESKAAFTTAALSGTPVRVAAHASLSDGVSGRAVPDMVVCGRGCEVVAVSESICE